MRCDTFDRLVLDLDTGRAGADFKRAAVLAHLDDCARCRQRLETERRLSALLTLLARQVDEQPVPDRLEDALRAEFRAHASSRVAAASQPEPRPSANAPPPAAAAYWWLAATAALVVAAVGAAWLARPLESGASADVAVAGEERLDLDASGIDSIDWTGFWPVWGDQLPDLAGPAHVVTAELPVQALLSLGYPVEPDMLLGGTVSAEVLIGEDGVARAVRVAEVESFDRGETDVPPDS